MNELRYSLCPNCDACPEVIVGKDAVTIGEDGNQVRLSPNEWNVLVAAVNDGRLGAVNAMDEAAPGNGSGCDYECCA